MITTANQNIFDRIIQHSADVRLYEEGVQVNNRRIIRRHRSRLKDLLKKDIKHDVSREVSRFTTELGSNIFRSLRDLSTSELDFFTDNLYKEVKTFYDARRPRIRELLTEIEGPSIKGSRSVPANIKNIGTAELIRIQSRVRSGLALGQSSDVIVRKVLETTKITQHQAESLTRTSITSTQTAAMNRVIEENNVVLSGYMFTAILDARTSPTCQYHNGKIYAVDDYTWRPPLHWRCRSTMVPILKSQTELAATNSSRLNQAMLAKASLVAFNGAPPARESFSEWLKRQPMNIQTTVLGSEDKASLFRQNLLKVEEFVTPLGKVFSIEALRRKAAQITSLYRPRQTVGDVVAFNINVAKPSTLLSSSEAKSELRSLFINDAGDFNSTLALTDFKGTSLVGKQATRRRTANEFDERNFITDSFTGEVKSNLRYDPDFTLYQERIDFMRNSKDLTKDQKDFIESFATSLDDSVSVNQQTVAIENLRVVFQRYNNDKLPWENFASVIRSENRFAVQNVSRLLDTRSRQRSDLFGGFNNDDSPKVQILGKYYSVQDLQNDFLKDTQYAARWRDTVGSKLATQVYFRGRSPVSAYTQRIIRAYPTRKAFVKNLRNRFPLFSKAYDLLTSEKDVTDSWITRQVRSINETQRRVLDYEWKNFIISKPTVDLLDTKVKKTLVDAMELIASGNSTDYDALAINIGKLLHKELGNLNPLANNTLQDFHKQGSEILTYFKDQGLIKLGFRGKVRRGVWDVDTGRTSTGWGETLSREVVIVNKDLIALQEANARTVISRRFGSTLERDRLFVRAGKKTFFDARGNNTGIPIISSNKFANYDANQVDREIASMMNHVMNVEYSVDNDFVSFMDNLARFRDPRGRTEYYDSLNEFRHEIIRRGEAGYGLLSSAKYHNTRNKPFRTEAFIDSRARVYHRGYLTPTGGELVRPFLNSSRAKGINTATVDELRIQLGVLIGQGNETLTQSGRRASFKRNERALLDIGELVSATTQRDRRIREFLEHPLVRSLEGPEVAKLARLALEYTRIHKHVKGDFNNTSLLATYKTQLMIENDASASGAQIIGLSTRDRQIATVSNVIATTQKNRLYDLVAMDTINDPDYVKIAALRNANLTWEDLAKAAKAQNIKLKLCSLNLVNCWKL